MNRLLLRSLMILNGDNNSSLGRFLGLTRNTVANKINEKNGAEFTQSEIAKIVERYNLTGEQVMSIFFTSGVA